MENPFAYSNTVTGKSFCNRTREISELMKYIEASQNVLLYSHRRIGKSSLIQQVFQKIQASNLKIGTLHIDLYGTISEKDFIIRTFNELRQLESNFERLVKSITNTVKNIRLNIQMDPLTGSPTISPSFSAVEEKTMLEELMNILQKYSQKQKLVIAFDEFQEIADYTEAGFEKRLRSFIQSHGNICYIFSGSRQHLMTEMFNSNKRAFFKMADSFPLDKISTEAYLPWIKGLFQNKNITLSDKQLETIVSRFENHPMYIQNFLFHLWEDKPAKELTTAVIDKIEGMIVEKKAIEYSTLWETLTVNQKKTLKLILLNNGSNLYTADSLHAVSLSTASLVSKALASLMKKEIIAKNGHYIIQDIVFKKWLFRTLSLQY
ncbi:ATP-binding protein [bacterium]|nr:ATP-binding protein [bacterium]